MPTAPAESAPKAAGPTSAGPAPSVAERVVELSLKEVENYIVEYCTCQQCLLGDPGKGVQDSDTLESYAAAFRAMGVSSRTEVFALLAKIEEIDYDLDATPQYVPTGGVLQTLSL